MSAESEPANGRTIYRREGPVAIIELDNPPLNVVSLAMTASLDRHLAMAAEDRSARAVVLTGRGNRAFCAGSDIGEFDAYMAPGQVVELKLRTQNEIFDRLEGLAKPTVAALDALAYGGGLEIALCCDLIVAAQSVRLALPELNLGVFPSSGGPIRLARRIGPSRAKKMIFTSEPLEARAAHAIGLVDEVVPDGTALDAGLAFAARIANRPTIGLAAVKDLINSSFSEDASTLREKSLRYSDRAFSSPECVLGVQAFRARTTPNFADAAHDGKPADVSGAPR